jgi:hypothetical protein
LWLTEEWLLATSRERKIWYESNLKSGQNLVDA